MEKPPEPSSPDLGPRRLAPSGPPPSGVVWAEAEAEAAAAEAAAASARAMWKAREEATVMSGTTRHRPVASAPRNVDELVQVATAPRQVDELVHNSMLLQIEQKVAEHRSCESPAEHQSASDCAAAERTRALCKSLGNEMEVIQEEEVTNHDAELQELRAITVLALDRLWAHCASSGNALPALTAARELWTRSVKAVPLASAECDIAPDEEPSPDDGDDVLACKLRRWAARIQEALLPNPDSLTNCDSYLPAELPLSGGRSVRIELPAHASDAASSLRAKVSQQTPAASLRAMREHSVAEMGRKMADMNVRLSKTADLEKENWRLKREVSLLEARVLEEGRNAQVMRLQLEQCQRALGRHREAHAGYSKGAGSTASSSTTPIGTPRDARGRPAKTPPRGGSAGHYPRTPMPAAPALPTATAELPEDILRELGVVLRKFDALGNDIDSAVGSASVAASFTLDGDQDGGSEERESSVADAISEDSHVRASDPLQAAVNNVQRRCYAQWRVAAVRDAVLVVERSGEERMLRFGPGQRRVRLVLGEGGRPLCVYCDGSRVQLEMVLLCLVLQSTVLKSRKVWRRRVSFEDGGGALSAWSSLASARDLNDELQLLGRHPTGAQEAELAPCNESEDELDQPGRSSPIRVDVPREMIQGQAINHGKLGQEAQRNLIEGHKSGLSAFDNCGLRGELRREYQGTYQCKWRRPSAQDAEHADSELQLLEKDGMEQLAEPEDELPPAEADTPLDDDDFGTNPYGDSLAGDSSVHQDSPGSTLRRETAYCQVSDTHNIYGADHCDDSEDEIVSPDESLENATEISFTFLNSMQDQVNSSVEDRTPMDLVSSPNSMSSAVLISPPPLVPSIPLAAAPLSVTAATSGRAVAPRIQAPPDGPLATASPRTSSRTLSPGPRLLFQSGVSSPPTRASPGTSSPLLKVPLQAVPLKTIGSPPTVRYTASQGFPEVPTFWEVPTYQAQRTANPGQVHSAPNSARGPVAVSGFGTPGRSGNTPLLKLDGSAGSLSAPRTGSATYPQGTAFSNVAGFGTRSPSGFVAQGPPGAFIAMTQPQCLQQQLRFG